MDDVVIVGAVRTAVGKFGERSRRSPHRSSAQR